MFSVVMDILSQEIPKERLISGKSFIRHGFLIINIQIHWMMDDG